MTQIIISGPQVYTEDGILREASLIINHGIIEDMVLTGKAPQGHVVSFPSSYHLVPGFIDLHVHGANGKDVMDADEEALCVMSKALAAEGVTSFLATTMTASKEKITNALRAVRDYQLKPHDASGAAILGVHLEGPFISPKKVGAQSVNHILHPDVACIANWQKQFDQVIKLVTLAPELPNSIELIRYLRDHHIVASIGHSDATYAETQAAIAEGCHYVTHLFNAMRGMHQREPGVVTAALLSEKVKTELIVDGVHLHPAIVELAMKMKGIDHLILVTDAMRAKCLGNGSYDLGGQAVQVKSGVATLSDGTLAGSVLRMPDAIRNIMKYTSCDLYDAVKMASNNPAKVLGIEDKKGSIALDKEADLVVLDDHLGVVMTMVGGKVVYQANYKKEHHAHICDSRS